MIKRQEPIDSNWIRGHLPQALQADIAKAFVADFQHHHEPVGQQIRAFLTACSASIHDAGDRQRILAFLAEASILAGRLDEAEAMISGVNGMAAALIGGFSAFLRGNKEPSIPFYHADPFSHFFQSLVLYWVDKKRARRSIKLLKVQHAWAGQTGYAWLAAEVSALLAQLRPSDKKYSQEAEAFFKTTEIESIVGLIQPVSQWQQALNALISLKKQDRVEVETEKSSRLVWLLSVNEKYGDWNLSPREQIKTAKGGWTKGRKIALKRLYHEIETFDFLTPQDEMVCASIQEDSFMWRGYPDINYHFTSMAIKALADHPLVFSEKSPEVRLEIVKGQPELLVNRREDGKFEISLPHPVCYRGIGRCHVGMGTFRP